jgi:hypothetical protein
VPSLLTDIDRLCAKILNFAQIGEPENAGPVVCKSYERNTEGKNHGRPPRRPYARLIPWTGAEFDVRFRHHRTIAARWKSASDLDRAGSWLAIQSRSTLNEKRPAD